MMCEHCYIVMQKAEDRGVAARDVTDKGARERGRDVPRWMCRLSVLSEKLDLATLN